MHEERFAATGHHPERQLVQVFFLESHRLFVFFGKAVEVGGQLVGLGEAAVEKDLGVEGGEVLEVEQGDGLGALMVYGVQVVADVSVVPFQGFLRNFHIVAPGTQVLQDAANPLGVETFVRPLYVVQQFAGALVAEKVVHPGVEDEAFLQVEVFLFSHVPAPRACAA